MMMRFNDADPTRDALPNVTRSAQTSLPAHFSSVHGHAQAAVVILAEPRQRPKPVSQ